MAKSRNKPRRTKKTARAKRSPEGAVPPRVLKRTVHPHGTSEFLAEYTTVSTPSFGVVRQCRYRFTYPDGRTWDGWTWDPTWRHEQIPTGAIRGDISKQNSGAFGEPRYWYLDRGRRCVQCSRDFVFTAREQKYWYETLGFYGESVAVRCAPCRKTRRTAAALRTALGESLRATEQNPRSPGAWLDLAWATERIRTATGEGDLNRGISAARKARTFGEGVSADLVEASLQTLAGRPDKAAATLIAALERPLTRRERSKIETARELLNSPDRAL